MTQEEWPDKEGYPDLLTRNVLKWCEVVDNIEQRDDVALPKLLQDTSTEILLDVLDHYMQLFADYQKLGAGIAPFSAWDHEVRHAIRNELLTRGIALMP